MIEKKDIFEEIYEFNKNNPEDTEDFLSECETIAEYEFSPVLSEKSLQIIDSIRSGKKPAYYWNKLGGFFSSQKQYENSLRCYAIAVALDSSQKFVWNNIGSVFKDLGQYDLALKYYEENNRIYPDYNLGIYNRAVTYYNLGNYDTARELFTILLEKDVKSNISSIKRYLEDLDVKKTRDSSDIKKNEPEKEFKITEVPENSILKINTISGQFRDKTLLTENSVISTLNEKHPENPVFIDCEPSVVTLSNTDLADNISTEDTSEKQPEYLVTTKNVSSDQPVDIDQPEEPAKNQLPLSSSPVPWLNIVKFHKAILERDQDEFYSLRGDNPDSKRWSLIQNFNISSFDGPWEIKRTDLSSERFNALLKKEKTEEITLGGPCWISYKKQDEVYVYYLNPLMLLDVVVEYNEERDVITINPDAGKWTFTPQLGKFFDKLNIHPSEAGNDTILKLIESASEVAKRKNENLSKSFVEELFSLYPQLSSKMKTVDPYKNISYEWTLFTPPETKSEFIQHISRDYDQFEKTLALKGGNGGLSILDNTLSPSRINQFSFTGFVAQIF